MKNELDKVVKSRKEINDIFSLRSEVFIVEQECAYQDVDGKDKQADHVMLHIDKELHQVGYIIKKDFDKQEYFLKTIAGRSFHRMKVTQTIYFKEHFFWKSSC